MKKNYIAPATEMATWASMGLMTDPVITVNTVSGGTGTATTGTTDNMDFID